MRLRWGCATGNSASAMVLMPIRPIVVLFENWLPSPESERGCAFAMGAPRKEGLQDWLAAEAAARQLSTDGTITSVLISYKLEREMSDVLEPELGKFSQSELDFLLDGARRLPSGTKMQSAIAREKLIELTWQMRWRTPTRGRMRLKV